MSEPRRRGYTRNDPRVNKRYDQDLVLDRARLDERNLKRMIKTASARLEQVEREIVRLSFSHNPIVPDIWKSARAFE